MHRDKTSSVSRGLREWHEGSASTASCSTLRPDRVISGVVCRPGRADRRIHEATLVAAVHPARTGHRNQNGQRRLEGLPHRLPVTRCHPSRILSQITTTVDISGDPAHSHRRLGALVQRRPVADADRAAGPSDGRLGSEAVWAFLARFVKSNAHHMSSSSMVLAAVTDSPGRYLSGRANVQVVKASLRDSESLKEAFTDLEIQANDTQTGNLPR